MAATGGRMVEGPRWALKSLTPRGKVGYRLLLS
jgi:hypothetical protein